MAYLSRAKNNLQNFESRPNKFAEFNSEKSDLMPPRTGFGKGEYTWSSIRDMPGLAEKKDTERAGL